MCEPTTIAAISLVVASGLYTADAQREAGRAQAIMAERNAETNDQRAQLANRIGSIEEDRHRAKVRGLLGAQRANMAARGIDPDSGTALAFQDETIAFGETDAMTIRYNAARQAWGFGVEANNDRATAAVTRTNTKNAVTGTYLTTASRAFGMGAAMWGGGSASSAASSKAYTPVAQGGRASYGSYAGAVYS